MFTIIVTTAKGETQSIPFQGDSASIGKADDNAVQLKGWTIGKKHASLVRRDGQLFVEDHGGLSVTEVNGKAIDERYGPLKDDDVIQIGGHTISVRAADAAAPGAQPPGQSIEELLSATLNRPIPAYQPRPLSPSAPLPNPAAAREAPAPARAELAPPRPPAGAAPRAAPAPAAVAAAPAFDPNLTTRTHARVQADARVAPMNKARQQVHTKLISMMDLRRVDVSRMEEQELRSTTSELIREIINETRDLPPDLDRESLAKQVLDEVVGLGPLEELLADDAVTEIMVNRYDEIFIERGGKLTESEITFTSDNAVLQAIERIVAPLGRRIDESSPMVDARLKDGSRVNAVIPPLALKGCNITIRKFAKNKLQDADLIKYGSVTADMMAFLKVAVEHGTNIIISGGTGSGKTTLLNVLSSFIPDDERIVTVEDAAELQLVAAQPGVAGVAPGQRGRQGRDPHPRPGQELPAHAARPHRGRRMPRRRGAGHAAGDEHRSRRLAHHRPRQHAARLHRAAGGDGADVGARPADPGDPRADRVGRAPDRAAEPLPGRQPQGDARDGDHRHRRRRDPDAGHLPVPAGGLRAGRPHPRALQWPPAPSPSCTRACPSVASRSTCRSSRRTGSCNLGLELVIGVVALAAITVIWALIQVAETGLRKQKQTLQAQAAGSLSEMFIFVDPTKLFYMNVLALVFVPAALYVTTENPVLALGAAILSIAGPKLLVAWLKKRRERRFEEQLPDALLMIAGTLRAGASLNVAMESMVSESKPPVSQEFELMLREQRLGVDLDTALQNMEKRMPLQDFIMVVAGMRISREVGGNLADTLEAHRRHAAAQAHHGGQDPGADRAGPHAGPRHDLPAAVPDDDPALDGARGDGAAVHHLVRLGWCWRWSA